MKHIDPLFYVTNNVKILEFLHSKNDKLYLQKKDKELPISENGDLYLQKKDNELSIIFYANAFNKVELFKFLLTIDKSLYKTEKLNGKSVFYYACMNGRIEILKYLYSIDKNIYKDEPNKTELIENLKTKQNYMIVLPFILEIIIEN